MGARGCRRVREGVGMCKGVWRMQEGAGEDAGRYRRVREGPKVMNANFFAIHFLDSS